MRIVNFFKSNDHMYSICVNIIRLLFILSFLPICTRFCFSKLPYFASMAAAIRAYIFHQHYNQTWAAFNSIKTIWSKFVVSLYIDRIIPEEGFGKFLELDILRCDGYCSVSDDSLNLKPLRKKSVFSNAKSTVKAKGLVTNLQCLQPKIFLQNCLVRAGGKFEFFSVNMELE